MWPEPVTLTDIHVRLEPLRADHAEGAREAVQDGDIWKLWYTTIPAPDAVEAEIARRLALQAQGKMLPFATCAPDGTVLGMTTYMNLDPMNKRLEIGSTFLRVSAHRSPVNTQAKRLMLAHAFDDLGCIAVEFRTHVMNRQSRAAIERLGARLDGILRRHMLLANGTVRDTCVYSITAEEWPSVRAGLNARLGR